MKSKSPYRPMPQHSLEDLSLLKSSTDGDCSLHEVCTHSSTCAQKIRHLMVVLVFQSLVLLVIFGAVLGVYINRGPNNASAILPQSLYSPVQNVITYETRVFHEGFGSDQSLYQQSPSPEVDEAWDDLYNFGVSRITKEEASSLVNYTYRLPGDEDHYVIQLDVFHQLHCLNMLRKAIHPDYYADMPGHHLDKSHWGHCIESIRQSLMCSADVAPLVWQWVDRVKEVRIMGNIIHTCRNYDKIRDWGLERRLDHELNFTGFH